MKNYYTTVLLFFVTICAFAQAPFITTWEVTEGDLDIKINTTADGYNYSVDFGDGFVLNNVTDDATHVYATPGIYTVSINGDFPRISMHNSGVTDKILSVEQWGDIQWLSMRSAFRDCFRLAINATDTPDLSQVEDMSFMFYNASSFNSNINNWDVSNVENMQRLFRSANSFNQPLDNWNVSNVLYMSGMFQYANSFNQPLNSWDVSSVINMQSMFGYADVFNQPLDSWDVSSVDDLSSMFSNAEDFNQSINSWDVSNASTLVSMFASADQFNQPLDNWDLSNVIWITSMFSNADSFNQPLNNWDVSNINGMAYLFSGADSFNQPVDAWNVSNVNYMNYMFRDAKSFNQPLNSWDVSSVTDMEGMFDFQETPDDEQVFNQSLDNWDVSNVVDMDRMFYNVDIFDQPLDSWDVSSVRYMRSMFKNAEVFNQPLNSWDVSSVEDMESMFRGADTFNQPLDAWDISSVNNMEAMFENADSFNQPLNIWDVSNVTYLTQMFRNAISFNQPLDTWDVSNIRWMEGVFMNASSFNQDISSWDLREDVFLEGSEFNSPYAQLDFIRYSGLDVENYEAFLNKLAALNLNEDTLRADGLNYCDETARNELINNQGWSITNDELSSDCNLITGTILYDENENGCDASDTGVSGFMVSATDGANELVTFSNNGEYSLGTLGSAFTVSLQNMPSYFTADPISVDVDFTGSNTETVDFCITANEAIDDLIITLLPITEARPGFQAEYQLIVENMGTQNVADVTVSLNFDDTAQFFINATPSPISTTGNQLVFELSNLGALTSQNIDFTLQTFTPPTVNGDDVLLFNAIVGPNTTDNMPENNTFVFEQIVVNSFDPNDKQVVQGEEIFEEQVDDYLDYIIRFQNTGTASAINVRIEDLLHPNLDWATIQPLSASHNYQVEITNGNNVQFIFDNINLPDEDSNELESHGYIAYKIKPLSSLVIGDFVSGDASIFFDFNAPIITNIVTTTIVEEIDEFPNAICQDMQVQIDDFGNVLLDATIIGLNSTDDNGITSYEVSPDSFDCSDLGFQSVMLTVTDTGGNQSTCESMIEVIDLINPTAECSEDITVIINQGEIYTLPDYFLDGNISVTDNCTTTFTNYLQSPIQETELTQGSYTIEIEVFDDSDNMGTCSFVLTVEEVLGTNENALLNDNLKIYPNPVTSVLNIETTANIIIEHVVIVSISGKQLFETTSNSIDFSSLQNGLYFVEITTSVGAITKKVFKK